jgi:quercetin dioxygenase-like cupin family protein
VTIVFRDIPWESPAPGLETKTVVQGDKRLRLVQFGRDFVEPEWCTRGHAGFMLEGAIEVDIDGTVVRYQAGDGLLIPAGEATRHRHHATLRPATLFLVEDVE